eukprot:4743786-Prymnesium_polylepis.1
MTRAGRAGPGAGSKEALRGGGCRRRTPDSGQLAAISRLDRSRVSPSVRGSARRTAFPSQGATKMLAAPLITAPRRAPGGVVRSAVQPQFAPTAE